MSQTTFKKLKKSHKKLGKRYKLSKMSKTCDNSHKLVKKCQQKKLVKKATTSQEKSQTSVEKWQKITS